MKIRSDFVSNSSSSSFIVAVPFDKFDIFRSQIAGKSDDYYKQHNLSVVRNYLNSSHVSLFGGLFVSGYKFTEISDPEDYFFKERQYADTGKIKDLEELKYVNEMLKWKDDTKKTVICKYAVNCWSRIMNDIDVQKILEIKDDNEFLIAVQDPKSILGEFEDFYGDSTYIINRKTLEVAIRLRKLGKEVLLFGDRKFDVGDEFITELLKLTENNAIYRIDVTMSGDGVDNDALRKEDNIDSSSEFFKDFKIISTEWV